MWKKYLWVKNLIFLCLASYLLAKIGNTLLLAGLRASSPHLSQTRTTREVEPKVAGKKSAGLYRSISQRNVFNSEYKGEAEDAQQPKNPASVAALQKTDMNIQLIGTVVGSSRSSFAIVEDPQTREQEMFRIDDMIRDQARVVSITRCRVVLLRGGNEETLECEEVESREAQRPSPVPSANSSTGDDSFDVKMLSENEYVIDQRAVANELSDYNRIMTQVGIGPNFQGGKQDGLRVSSVKPNSFWAKAGLRRGDVIRRVNDLELSSVDSTMQAFDTMRKGEDVSMEVSRGGTSQSIHWEIR